MTTTLALYQKLPHSLRVLLSNTRAWQLKQRRYGPVFWSALPRIRERVHWEKERWEAWQLERLEALVRSAETHVPAYRRPRPDGPSPDAPSNVSFWPGGAETARRIISRWPLLDRQWCREHPEALLDSRLDPRHLFSLYTSGTTGSPQKIYRDPKAEQLHYAYSEARHLNLAGVTMADRWAIMGGQLIVPVSRRTSPFWIYNRPLKQLYLSSYHLGEENGPTYLDALERFRPVFLYGYASSLYWLARQALRIGRTFQLKVAISNAEPLYANQRAVIKSAFQCEIRDTYGSAEGVAQGFECAAERMHVSPDQGLIEILLPDGRPCGPGEVGEIVATGLSNAAMVLIRYRTGDSGAWAEDQTCRCGCTFPILAGIEGRTDDLLETAGGGTVGRLDPVFKAGLPIREAQIIQRSDLSLEIRVVPEPGFNSGHEDQIIGELRARMGEGLPIILSRVTEIPRAQNGKFRAVVREPRASVR